MRATRLVMVAPLIHGIVFVLWDEVNTDATQTYINARQVRNNSLRDACLKLPNADIDIRTDS